MSKYCLQSRHILTYHYRDVDMTRLNLLYSYFSSEHLSSLYGRMKRTVLKPFYLANAYVRRFYSKSNKGIQIMTTQSYFNMNVANLGENMGQTGCKIDLGKSIDFGEKNY